MSDSRVRLSIVGVVALALFSALFARLWYLQVASADEFRAAASRNSVKIVREPAVRGRILDARGNVLADNRVANVITVDRRIDGKIRTQMLRRLALLLGTPVAELRTRLADPRTSLYKPVPVAIDVPYETLAYVSEHRRQFPGVRAEAIPIRQYPNGSVAFHLLGYTGEINEEELKTQLEKGRYQLGDPIGKSGVELSYEVDLRGEPGVTEYEVDSTGQVIRRIRSTAPVPGHDVRLTMDLGAQRVAEDALRQGMAEARRVRNLVEKKKFETLRAPAGAVVVLDSTTGSVVAMTSLPDFNANEFVNGIPQTTWDWLSDPANHKPLFNRAVSGTYAPGSTFKLVSAVAGLRTGIVSATRTINDNGKYSYPTDPDFVFSSEGPNGPVALARALAVSSDVYFYSIGGDLYTKQRRGEPGGDALQAVAREFGFGSATGVALPSEAVGRVPDADWKRKIHEANPTAFPFPDWLPGDNIQSAIGQGDILVTPIQLAGSYAALANGGTRYSPRLADKVIDRRNRDNDRDLPAIDLGQIDIPERDTLLAGFAGVISDAKGTAYNAFAGFPAELAAGKTGTAQVFKKQNTSWFVGMTPAANPRYVVLAVVEEGGYGAQTAAPIARAVMEQLNGLPVGKVRNVAPPQGN